MSLKNRITKVLTSFVRIICRAKAVDDLVSKHEAKVAKLNCCLVTNLDGKKSVHKAQREFLKTVIEQAYKDSLGAADEIRKADKAIQLITERGNV